MKGLTTPRVLSVLAFVSVMTNAYAAIPAGYYNQADNTNATTLRNSLHEIIDDHQRFPYTSSATDTWDILELADQDPDNAGNVIDIYKNASYAKEGGGNTFYNREHSWPKSYGFPNDGSTNYAYTDTHHLFIANSSYNSSRSNKPYANCNSSCTEKVTEFNNNRGGTSSQSNWTTGSYENGTWETWSGRRGDVARALMYMAVRYEGGTHSITGVSEPDLILTDDRTLIGNSSTGSNISVAYMGLKSVLLQWHQEDPVDDLERQHNDTVYSFQGNRNPFVDNPDYVACVFENVCSGEGPVGDSTPPAAPTGFSATGGNGFVELAWSANVESDLAGYNVYRATSSGGSFVKINTTLVNTSAYTDSAVAAGTTYFYKVSAVDSSSNESALSQEASATTESGGGTLPGTVWINELHYDNASSDVNEMVEVAGTAGTNLSGWTIVAYNGNGGGQYKTINLSGSISDQQGGFGVVSVAATGLQNGAPDGIALVDSSGTVVQFLSYEGAFTATDGPAAGQASINIGVSETSSTPVGHSLQLAGSGSAYSDFSWQSAQANTAGSVNTGQSFSGGSAPVNQDPNAAFSANCTDLTCNFDASTSTDSDGSIVSYSWDFGDTNVATGITPSHSYSSAGSYSVTLTVTDNDGATNMVTNQVTVEAAATGVTVLQNGVAETNIAGGQAEELVFSIEVPAGASNLSFTMSGGSGDADLYVRFGSEPTSSVYDCRPYLNGNDESCNFATPSTGTYYVKVIGYTAFSGISLVANYTESGGGAGQGASETYSNLSASRGDWLYFSVDVPAGMSALTATLTGGSGDADLYVRQGVQPTRSTYDCRSYQSKNEESCFISNPAATTWHIGIRAHKSYSGATLTIAYQP